MYVSSTGREDRGAGVQGLGPLVFPGLCHLEFLPSNKTMRAGDEQVADSYFSLIIKSISIDQGLSKARYFVFVFVFNESCQRWRELSASEHSNPWSCRKNSV